MDIKIENENKLRKYRNELILVKQFYSQLVDIVKLSSELYYTNDRLNNYYKEIFQIAEASKSKIPNDLFDMILYKPFTNLYVAKKEMGEDGRNWNTVINRMEACLGAIDGQCEAFDEYDLFKLLDEQDQSEYFEFYRYLKQLRSDNLKEIATRKTLNKSSTESQKMVLTDAIPQDGKHKNHRRMAKLFQRNNSVKNYLLASCITPTIRSLNSKLKKFGLSEYIHNPKLHNDRIKNCFRVLNRLWGALGYRVKFHPEASKLIKV